MNGEAAITSDTYSAREEGFSIASTFFPLLAGNRFEYAQVHAYSQWNMIIWLTLYHYMDRIRIYYNASTLNFFLSLLSPSFWLSFTFSDHLLPLIKREVPFESLIRHLEKSDRNVQQNALALMNSLFLRADSTSKDSIAKVGFIDAKIYIR